jgi:hypothetical protein
MISAFAFCGGSSYVPTDIGAGLKLWLLRDAASVTVVTGASQLSDATTNAYHLTQGTTGKQPAYNATGGPGSTPIVTLDGVDDEMQRTLAVTSIISASAYTVYAVLRLDAQPDVGSDLADSASYDNDGVIGDATWGGWAMNLRRTGPRVQVGHYQGLWPATGVNVSTGTWYRVRWKYDGTNITLKVGGSSVASVAATNVNTGAILSTLIKIGTNYSGSDFGAFSLANLMVYNIATSAGDDTNIDGYLAGRFGSGPINA